MDVRDIKNNSAYDRGEEVIAVTYKSLTASSFKTNHVPEIKGVKKVRIKRVAIPKTYYELGSGDNRTFVYNVAAAGNRTITINVGTYTPEQLASELTRAIRQGHADGQAAGFQVFWETNLPNAAPGSGSLGYLIPGKFIIRTTVGSAFTLTFSSSINLARMLGAAIVSAADGSYTYGIESSVALDGFNYWFSSYPANVVRFPTLSICSNTLALLFNKKSYSDSIVAGPVQGFVRYGTVGTNTNIIATIPTGRDSFPVVSHYYSDPNTADDQYDHTQNCWHGTGYLEKEFTVDDGYLFSPTPVTLNEVDWRLIDSNGNLLPLNNPDGFEVEVWYYCQKYGWTG